MQAASVTMTSTSRDQKLPSLARATAVSVCEVARRMRVASCARPLAGVGARQGAGELRQRLLDPRALNPDSIMPPVHRTEGLTRVGQAWKGKPVLTSQQVEDVVAYLQTLR